MSTAPEPRPPDFSLLQQAELGQARHGRRVLWWLLWLFLPVLASALGLVLHLAAFESAQDERRRATDGRSIEQSVQFHFRRFEVGRDPALGITPRTVEFHRANIFEKPGLSSAVELAHQLGRLQASGLIPHNDDPAPDPKT